MLYTRCILFPESPEDGYRISVMSRHTLEDGVTPDRGIKSFHLHLPILGPSPRLIGDFYKRGLPWEEFEERYLDEIRRPMAESFVRRVAKMATKKDVTLLCIERSHLHCHRRLLAEECQRAIPDLLVEHR